MSKLQFQAKVSLDSVMSSGDDWEAVISLRDGEGVFQGRDLTAGDVLVFNTSIVEPGTYTQYVISEVVNVDWLGGVTVILSYSSANNNDSPNPPMDYFVGSEAMVSRPSVNRGLLPIVASSVQDMTDTYGIYTLNHNLSVVLDTAQASAGVNAKLITARYLRVGSDGRAALPSAPLGDFVLDMAMLFMFDGSILEVMGVLPEQDPETEQWYAVIPAQDMATIAGTIGAMSVSYLIDASATNS